ncbi:MAG: antitoxin family protein [Deltaproteobacteria bacterium]|nr:antitoxin family protein [Deltaproteobacteria bacterium]
MSKRVEAVYENGVLRPLEPLGLREHQRVSVIVSEKPVLPSEEEWLDTDCLQFCASEADESVSLEAVREALSKIPGSLTADFIAEREEL